MLREELFPCSFVTPKALRAPALLNAFLHVCKAYRYRIKCTNLCTARLKCCVGGLAGSFNPRSRRRIVAGRQVKQHFDRKVCPLQQLDCHGK